MLFHIVLGLCTYFFQKPVNMILEDHLLKSFWTVYDMLCHLVYKMFPLSSMT